MLSPFTQTYPAKHYGAKLVPRPFRAVLFGFAYNLTRDTTLCQNILSAIRKFARISKFRSFHETKKAQSEIEMYMFFFFYNLGTIYMVSGTRDNPPPELIAKFKQPFIRMTPSCLGGRDNSGGVVSPRQPSQAGQLFFT